MNILIISDHFPPDKIGGVWLCVKELKRCFESKGHNTLILSIGGKKANDHKENIIRPFKNFFLGIFFNNFIALYLIFTNKIDIIYNHQSSSPFFLLFNKIPFINFPKVVSTFHMTFFSEYSEVKDITISQSKFSPTTQELVQKYLFAPVHLVLDLISYLASDTVTAVSSEILAELDSTYGKLCKKESVCIPNGGNHLLVCSKNDDSSIKNKIKELCNYSTVITYCGVFRVRKRLFNLLFAFKKVIETYPGTKLILIGGGRGYENLIRETIHKLGIDKEVICTGLICNETANEILDISDIVCLPSSKEGLPISLLEAMWAKKPIVTTNTSGMKEFFEDKKNALLTEVDNIESLSKALCYLIENPDNATQIGLNARTLIEEELNWEKVAENYLALFN